MVADEIAELALRAAFNVAVEFVPELIFNKYVARYFHGVGRHVVMLLTLGFWRIPSSLREVPKGSKAKPTAQDWFALLVGIATWVASAILVWTFLF